MHRKKNFIVFTKFRAQRSEFTSKFYACDIYIEIYRKFTEILFYENTFLIWDKRKEF